MTTDSVSIVIPSYRSLRTLGFTLRSVFAQTGVPAFEVVVVDSSGTDLGGWIRARFPRVRLIQPPNRLFPGAARNLGVESSNGALLAFLDADVIVDPGWLSELRSRLHASGADAAGGYVANGNPETQASRVQHWLEFSEFLPGSASGPRTFLSTSNLLIYRDKFLVQGGFAAEWAMSEDMLFFHRSGLRAWFDGEVGVYHHHRSRWGEVLGHLRKLGFWSGRLRACEPLPGSGLRNLPAAALLLPLVRVPRVLLRVYRGRPAPSVRALTALPGLMAGAWAWAWGFRAGLRSVRSQGSACRRDEVP